MDSLHKFSAPPMKRKKRTKKGNKFVCSSMPRDHSVYVVGQQKTTNGQRNRDRHPPVNTTSLLELGDDLHILTPCRDQKPTLAEYKKKQQQRNRDSGRQNIIMSNEQQRPLLRVAPMPRQQRPQPDRRETELRGRPSEQAAQAESAKMLIFLQNGEQRLVTFTLPKESCTLQEVLEQVNVPISENTYVQCMQNADSEIDYFVSVGVNFGIEYLVKNHPMFGDVTNCRSSPDVPATK